MLVDNSTDLIERRIIRGNKRNAIGFLFGFVGEQRIPIEMFDFVDLRINHIFIVIALEKMGLQVVKM